MRTFTRFLVSAIGLAFAVACDAQGQPAPSKPATEATKAANRKVLQTLPFGDRADFEDAQRGFIGAPETLTIKNANGDGRLGPRELQEVHRPRQAGARLGQPEPVAQRAAQHAVRPVQGDGPHLPGARLRPLEHHLRPGRHRLDRVRSADLDRDGEGGATTSSPRSSASGRSSRWSTATRTSTTTAACAASSTRPTSQSGKVKIIAPSTSPSTRSARTSSPATS